MLALFIIALGIFLLPFAFPTPPPIVTRFQATRLLSPNGDERRDLARVSVRMRQPGIVTLEVADQEGHLVKMLMQDQAVPRGWVRAAWGGRDMEGRRVHDGPYAIRLHARSGAKHFRNSRRIILDTEAPGLALAEVRSAGLAAVAPPAQCMVTAVTDGDGQVDVAVTARPDGGEILRRVGRRTARDGAVTQIGWDGVIAAKPVAPGLMGLRVRATDTARNATVAQRTCWVGHLTGRVTGAGPRLQVLLRDADGAALPPSTPVTLRLYRRVGTPGRDARVLGGRIALAVRTTAGRAALRLPARIPAHALWLVADTPAGRALIVPVPR